MSKHKKSSGFDWWMVLLVAMAALVLVLIFGSGYLYISPGGQ